MSVPQVAPCRTNSGPVLKLHVAVCVQHKTIPHRQTDGRQATHNPRGLIYTSTRNQSSKRKFDPRHEQHPTTPQVTTENEVCLHTFKSHSESKRIRVYSPRIKRWSWFIKPLKHAVLRQVWMERDFHHADSNLATWLVKKVDWLAEWIFFRFLNLITFGRIEYINQFPIHKNKEWYRLSLPFSYQVHFYQTKNKKTHTDIKDTKY